jgi:hypothetical protein
MTRRRCGGSAPIGAPRGWNLPVDGLPEPIKVKMDVDAGAVEQLIERLLCYVPRCCRRCRQRTKGTRVERSVVVRGKQQSNDQHIFVMRSNF